MFERPKLKADYYLGSVLPDVRYFAPIRREQTHPAVADFLALHAASESRSFVIGYAIHLLIDELERDLNVGLLVQRRFRFLPRRFRSRITSMLSNTLIELYFLQNAEPTFSMAASENGVTRQLHIDQSSIMTLKANVDAFLKDTSLANIKRLLQAMGMLQSERVRQYLDIATAVEKHSAVKRFLLWRVRPVITVIHDELLRRIESNHILVTLIASIRDK